MTSVVDVWRAVDPEARLASGDPQRLGAAVRGVLRTRATPPHLPPPVEARLLVADAAVLGGRSLDGLVSALAEADLRPMAVILAGLPAALHLERAGDPLPIIASSRAIGTFADLAERYIDHADDELARVTGEVRLAAAEAAVADPDPGAPAGLVAARLRRGLAVSADGELRALHARPAGRTLAARFAAAHARLLATSPGRSAARRTNDGLWVLERRIRPGASVWLFDDLPFARIDEVAAEALTITLRALLRRPAAVAAPRPSSRLEPRRPAPVSAAAGHAPGPPPIPGEEALRVTLLAVARANGRVAPAARALGVHRNTVLYRLRRARAELGVDPRRPEDALRLLRESEARSS
jgi:PucR C-terminal helix-turn-helix domain